MIKEQIDDLTDWLIDREECVNERRTAKTKGQAMLSKEEIENNRIPKEIARALRNRKR